MSKWPEGDLYRVRAVSRQITVWSQKKNGDHAIRRQMERKYGRKAGEEPRRQGHRRKRARTIDG